MTDPAFEAIVQALARLAAEWTQDIQRPSPQYTHDVDVVLTDLIVVAREHFPGDDAAFLGRVAGELGLAEPSETERRLRDQIATTRQALLRLQQAPSRFPWTNDDIETLSSAIESLKEGD